MTKLADTAARLRALTELDSTLLVEAAAGTGKTALMAGRVTMLLAHGAEPGSIAAITFTELAASALGARVQRYVDDLLAERHQRDRNHLQVRDRERNSDDRDRHRDGGDDVSDRQPDTGDDHPDDIADHRTDTSGRLVDDGLTERPQCVDADAECRDSEGNLEAGILFYVHCGVENEK